MNAFTFIAVILLVVSLKTTDSGWSRRKLYAGNRSRSRGNVRVSSVNESRFFPNYKGGYIVDNWRRKCSKYNIENSVKNLIVGGFKAELNMFPYLVGLLLYQPPRLYQCGGSLITQRYILTAAHCLYRSIGAEVYLGSYIYDAENATFVYNVSSNDFIIHERYGRQGFIYDIALIRLQEPVVLSDKLNTITLAHSYMNQMVLEGEVVTAAGWGRITDRNITEFNVQLYYVDTRIIAHEKCMCYYLIGLVSSRSHVCTDGSNGVGSCDGDSGGPLIYYYNGVHFLVGITSFGSAGGCEIGFPTVYSRITNYLSWISKKTGLKIQ